MALVCSAGVHADTKPAAPPPKFLTLGEGEREWWYAGSFSTVSHLLALSDKQKGDCAAKFYTGAGKEDREGKRKLIEKTLAENPKIGPTSVVLGLLTQACGPLLPPPNR